MTVLVTGGAGYIGSHMVLELVDAQENVVVLDDLSTGNPSVIPHNVPLIKGDVGDTQLLSNIIKDNNINAIIHFAGSIIVPESVSNPLKYYLNNTVKSRALISAAVENNVKHLIFSSTAAVYGMAQTNPIHESHPLGPISPYGTSKMMTELMLQDVASAHNLSYIALRYFNVAGADPNGRSGQSTPNATHLIKVASKAVTGEFSKLQVYGTDYPTTDGTCVRDYIHVSDLAHAHKLALDYLRNGGESKVMNCGYGQGYSVLEVIDMVKRVSGVDFPVEHTEPRPGDPAELVACSQMAQQTLKWQPKLNDLNLIVKHALDWEKKIKNA